MSKLFVFERRSFIPNLKVWLPIRSFFAGRNVILIEYFYGTEKYCQGIGFILNII